MSEPDHEGRPSIGETSIGSVPTSAVEPVGNGDDGDAAGGRRATASNAPVDGDELIVLAADDLVELEDVAGVDSAVVVVDAAGDAEIVVLAVTGEQAADGADENGPVAGEPGAGTDLAGTDLGDDLAGDESAADDAEDDELADDDGFGDGSAAQDPFAALGALFGGGAGGNPLAGLLEQAQQMQAGMQDAQRRLAEQSVSGTSGGGLVRATVSGTGELMSLQIDPSVVDPTDVETLVDLVVAAVRAATADARALGEDTMSGAVPDFGGLTGGAAGPGALPGFGFGGAAGDVPGFAGLPDLGAIPDFSRMPGFGTTVPDLRDLPGAGPLAGPAGDDPDDDDLGPASGPAGV